MVSYPVQSSRDPLDESSDPLWESRPPGWEPMLHTIRLMSLCQLTSGCLNPFDHLLVSLMASLVYVSAVGNWLVVNVACIRTSEGVLLFLKRWRQSCSDVNPTICKEICYYSINWLDLPGTDLGVKGSGGLCLKWLLTFLLLTELCSVICQPNPIEYLFLIIFSLPLHHILRL